MTLPQTDLEQNYRAKARQNFERTAMWFVFALGAVATIIAAYVLGWGRPWIGWTCLAIAVIGVWWQYKLYSAVMLLAASKGIDVRRVANDHPIANEETESDTANVHGHNARKGLILGAKQCMSVAGWGGELPELDDDVRKNLLDMYGDEWLKENEELMRAMLAFVADFRMFAGPDGPKLRRYFQGDPRENSLLNIFACMEHADVLDQPTLQLGEPNLAAFTASFGLWHPDSDQKGAAPEPNQSDELLEYSKAGTSVILMLAMSFALDLREQQRAA